MRNHVALWAGVSAFFSTILAIGVIDIFDPSDQLRLASGIVVGFITGGAVFAKQKYDDAKEGRVEVGDIVMEQKGDKTIMRLELDDEAPDLRTKKEVTFRVKRL
jgi:hypothetical protein